MLDHKDGVAATHKRLQDLDQLTDVVEMKACCRLIENVESFSSGGPGEFFGELDPLGFTARECRRRLAEAKIIKTDSQQCFEFDFDMGDVREKLGRFDNAHFEHIVDAFPFVEDGKRFFIKPLSFAVGAGRPTRLLKSPCRS